VTDKLHPETMIAVDAAQDQGSASPGEKNIESSARGAGLSDGDAV